MTLLTEESKEQKRADGTAWLYYVVVHLRQGRAKEFVSGFDIGAKNTGIFGQPAQTSAYFFPRLGNGQPLLSALISTLVSGTTSSESNSTGVGHRDDFQGSPPSGRSRGCPKWKFKMAAHSANQRSEGVPRCCLPEEAISLALLCGKLYSAVTRADADTYLKLSLRSKEASGTNVVPSTACETQTVDDGASSVKPLVTSR